MKFVLGAIAAKAVWGHELFHEFQPTRNVTGQRRRSHRARSDVECRYAIEAMLVQDGTTSFDQFVSSVGSNIGQLVSLMESEFGEVKLGVSSFADKPIPAFGLGDYGAWTERSAPDYCYRNHVAMTKEVDALVSGIRQFQDSMGSGGDFPENPYESVLFGALDESAGWTPVEITHSEQGLPISRIMLIVTDNIPHYEGEGYWGIKAWNDGFGTADAAWLVNPYDGWYEKYLRLVELMQKGTSLSPEETSEKDSLLKAFGPAKFDELIAHPGDSSVDCKLTEYPSLIQVGSVLKSKRITPIFLTVTPNPAGRPMEKKCKGLGMQSDAKCLKAIYESDLISMGLHPLAATADGDVNQFFQNILQAIQTVTELSCLNPNGPPAAGQTTTTEEAAVGGGVGAGVIGGAAAGAVAGLAALGGLLYKKFGAGLLKKEGGEIVHGEQANTAEDQVEREDMENITFDMFQ